MSGQYTKYYCRIGKGKSKKYRCVFKSCNNHIVKKLSSIYSHIERTHRPEINEIEKRKQKEIEREREAKEFAEIQLEEYRRMLPQIRLQNKLKQEAEQRRVEMNRKICQEMWETYEENIKIRQQRESIKNFFVYHMIVKKEQPTLEDFGLYYSLG